MGRNRRRIRDRKESRYSDSEEVLSFYESAREAITKLPSELLSQEVKDELGIGESESTDKVS